MVNPDSSPTFIDLFAGLGGFRLGLEKLGFECVYGSDNNKHAAQMYEANFDEKVLSDITKLDPETLPDFDILCGGFPCQPFSAAGKRLGFEDTRGTLFFNICKIIETKQPKIVFLENVKNLRIHDGGKTFKTIINSLEELGYTVQTQLYNANNFGVPQSRERILIVATKNTKKDFNFNKVELTVPKLVLKDFLLPPTTKELEWLDPNKYVLLPEDKRKTQPKTGLRFAGYIKGNLRVTDVKPDAHNISRSHKQYNRIYSDEGSHSTLSAQEKSGRYWIETLNKKGVKAVRRLTVTECYKLFGYPDTYKRVGALTEQYARIGNSICVPMVTAIGKVLKQIL